MKDRKNEENGGAYYFDIELCTVSSLAGGKGNLMVWLIWRNGVQLVHQCDFARW